MQQLLPAAPSSAVSEFCQLAILQSLSSCDLSKSRLAKHTSSLARVTLLQCARGFAYAYIHSALIYRAAAAARCRDTSNQRPALGENQIAHTPDTQKSQSQRVLSRFLTLISLRSHLRARCPQPPTQRERLSRSLAGSQNAGTDNGATLMDAFSSANQKYIS
jgi:hypothetical protein